MMKFFIFLVLMISANSFASGCNHDFSRTILESNLIASDYSLNEKDILVEDVAFVEFIDPETKIRSKFYWYGTVAIEAKPEGSSRTIVLEKRDVRFSEGSDCGPVYECISGQKVLKIYDPVLEAFELYANLVIPEVWTSIDYDNYSWVSESVLPVFGSMKSNVKILAEDGGDFGRVNRLQCGYGVW